MVQLQPKLLTAREFIDHFGNDSQYELIDRERIDLKPGHRNRLSPGFNCLRPNPTESGRESELIESSVFPNLRLTASPIFAAGQ